MSNITLDELALDAEREFQAVLGSDFRVRSREIFEEAYYRGGFHLMLANDFSEIVIDFSDLQFMVTSDALEIFGVKLHEGFAGNMFSRENLKKCLGRIAHSSAQQIRAAG